MRTAMHPLDAIKGPRSLTARAFEALRADIVACRFVPGQRLKIGDLCARFDVSLGAIREALSRLVAEGLVVAEAQKGFRVAPVSRSDLADLTTARVDIESLALRRSILYGDVAWEAGIQTGFDRLARMPERAESDAARLNDDWAEAHQAFHGALVAGCNSQWLLRMRSILFEQSERYRRLSVASGRKDRDVLGEHRRIMDATLGRDADRAVALLSEHILMTTRLLIALASTDGGGAAHAEAVQRRIA
ncbi:MAG: FCD domain-containing protein [Alphaproteobacteria bacterium]|nr:FCD domain-containing protein [Alphaproteobacteria bacterium]